MLFKHRLAWLQQAICKAFSLSHIMSLGIISFKNSQSHSFCPTHLTGTHTCKQGCCAQFAVLQTAPKFPVAITIASDSQCSHIENASITSTCIGGRIRGSRSHTTKSHNMAWRTSTEDGSRHRVAAHATSELVSKVRTVEKTGRRENYVVLVLGK